MKIVLSEDRVIGMLPVAVIMRRQPPIRIVTVARSLAQGLPIQPRSSGHSVSAIVAPRVIATGRIMATVVPGSIQSNRDRAELVALRRLGRQGLRAKVVEFLAIRRSEYVIGASIPIDGGLVRG